MEPNLPKRIRGYDVVRRLSADGGSEVFLARPSEASATAPKLVAVEVYSGTLVLEASIQQSFEKEAESYARLTHPAVVRLHDYFADGDLVALVLEHIEGLSLQEVRAALKQRGEELDDRAALYLGARVVAALAAAHGLRDATGAFAPVVHRDVNPTRVVVPWDGQAKLSHFCIAKVPGLLPRVANAQGDAAFGYLSPEQVRGESVTVRSDVYSAALILWELLARRRAIQRGVLPEAEVVEAMAHPQLPSLDVLRPTLPKPLRDALRTALDPAPDRRLVTADELWTVIRSSISLDEGRAMLVDQLGRARAVADAGPSAGALPLAGDGRPSGRTLAFPGQGPMRDRAPSVDLSASDARQEPLTDPTVPRFVDPRIADAAGQRISGVDPKELTAAPKVFSRPGVHEALRDVLRTVPPRRSEPPPPRSVPSGATVIVGGAAAAPPRAPTATARPPAPSSAALPPAGVPAEAAAPVSNSAAPLEGPAAVQQRDNAPTAVPRPPSSPLEEASQTALRTLPNESARPGAPGSPQSGAPPAVHAFQAQQAGRMATAVAPSERPHPSATPPLSSRGQKSVFASRGAVIALVAAAGIVTVGVVVAAWVLRGRSAAPAAAARVATAPATAGAAARTSDGPSALPPSALPVVRVPSSAAPSAPPVAAMPATAPPTEGSSLPNVLPPLPSARDVAPARPADTSASRLASAPKDGTLIPPPSAKGHRVFVDGRLAGHGTAPIVVSCGTHKVKVGSSGRERTVDVPCGGEVSFK